MQIVNGQPVESPVDEARQPLHLRMPFLGQQTGLGDVVKGITDRLGIPQCGGCQKRQEAMNRAMQFNPWST